MLVTSLRPTFPNGGSASTVYGDTIFFWLRLTEEWFDQLDRSCRMIELPGYGFKFMALQIIGELYPVYTIEQTSSRHRANVEKTSSRPDGTPPPGLSGNAETSSN